MVDYKENIACAIIAGGKSTRMDGVNKALLKIGNSSNIKKLLRLSEKFFSERIIVSKNNDFGINDNDIIYTSDIFKNIGPLGGIHAALSVTSKQAVFFFPSDMPFISSDLVEKEIAKFYNTNCDIIVPKINNRTEPLHSIYSVSVLEKLNNYLQNTKDYSIRNFYKKVGAYYWEIENNEENRKAFMNINTYNDLNNAINMISEN